MSDNEKKSKIMIFCRKKSKQQPFYFYNKELETVNSYTYLGIKISYTGNFSDHLFQSRDKAIHAFFAIYRKINFKNLKPLQANKLFDFMIRPILTYGSEVWGCYQKHDFVKWDTSPSERVHLRFCKFFLGVGSKASNIACRAELGRLPLKIFIDSLILKYFNHLINLPEHSLAKQALNISQSLSEQNKTSFIYNLNQMLRFYNLSDPKILENEIKKASLSNFKSKMIKNYINQWTLFLNSSKKLSFYKEVKTTYNEESYLNF